MLKYEPVEHWYAEPVEHIKRGRDEEQAEPQPDEDKDLLVEDVDHQHTLYGMPLVVAQHPHLEVALKTTNIG